MKIGIDISQTVFSGGVGEYLVNLLEELVRIDSRNEYILFGSSLRARSKFAHLQDKFKMQENVTFKLFSFPLKFLDILWNQLHILPIESLIGKVDIFITSDWIEPPVRSAKKITILYDVIVYKFPEETDSKIIKTQKRKLEWVKKESDILLCISESTKNDAVKILQIPENKLHVILPGITL